MLTFVRPRLRVPVIVTTLGMVLAIAWAVRGGSTWWLSIVFALGALGRFLFLYLLGGHDSDEGALAASRADERQKLASQRASALSGRITMIAAVLGLSGAIAAKAPADWAYAFLILLVLSVWTYALALQHYGQDE